MKILTVSLLSLVLLFSAVACDNKPQTTTTVAPAATDPVEQSTEPEAGAEREFTLDELAEFDGKDGKPAYVAVDGVVYDLTNSAAWKNGQHNGFQAGRELTDAIKNESPHGVGNLDGMPIVGKLVG